MGKIKIIGKAEHEYQPDLCYVYLKINTRKKTADMASKNTNDQCEKLLSDLVNKGFELKDIMITEDTVRSQDEDRYGYHRSSDDTEKEYRYEAKREIRLTVPANQRILNIIRDITENGYQDFTASTHFVISNEREIHKELLKEAIDDSREQAEYFSKLMGQKIIGIETANISDGDDYDDPIDPDRIRRSCLCDESSQRPLSDNLSIEKLKLDAEVNIVWLFDSDEKKS
ncbi:MAG: SIMPL domain-containing protein [Anaerolineaceae bacterium]|nr:SIMPL domain-containing protein [Anaerolineaceae bacterium]